MAFASVRPDLGTIVAKQVGRSAAMDALAEEVKSLAVGFASPHIRTGNYVSRLRVARIPGRAGVMDRWVGAGDSAAQWIDYGHVNAWSGKYVPGQKIVRQAVDNAG